MLAFNSLLESFQEDEDSITEAKISVMKRGIGSKRAALAGSTAMQIARQKNPAMYKMYMKHNLIRKQLKARINKQYGALAKAAARKKLR